jgi:hypothetical protein
MRMVFGEMFQAALAKVWKGAKRLQVVEQPKIGQIPSGLRHEQRHRIQQLAIVERGNFQSAPDKCWVIHELWTRALKLP